MKQENIKPTKVWAVTSMVTGILGILGCVAPYIFIFFSIMGIVFFGVNKRRGYPSTMATTGLVLGIIGCVLNVVMLGILALALTLSGVF